MRSKLFSNFFEDHPVNTARQEEMDLSRGFAVLFMIMVHVLEYFSDKSTEGSLYGSVISFLGGPPAAPVFMFLLGIGVIYSKKNSPHKLFKRGIILFASGYVLNIFRSTLPYYIGLKMNLASPEWLPYPLPYTVFVVDILQFAGLSFLFFSLLRKLNLNILFYPFIAAIIGFLSPMLWEIKTGFQIFDLILNPLFGKEKYVYFPFFSWMVYPLLGAFFGHFLMKVKDKKRFYRAALLLSLVMLTGYALFLFMFPKIDIGFIDQYAYFRHGLVGNFGFSFFVLFWISCVFFIKDILPGSIKKVLSFWSKQVTPIYAFHWLLIGWSILFFGVKAMNVYTTVLFTAAMIFTSSMIVYFYKTIEKSKSNSA